MWYPTSRSAFLNPPDVLWCFAVQPQLPLQQTLIGPLLQELGARETRIRRWMSESSAYLTYLPLQSTLYCSIPRICCQQYFCCHFEYLCFCCFAIDCDAAQACILSRWYLRIDFQESDSHLAMPHVYLNSCVLLLIERDLRLSSSVFKGDCVGIFTLRTYPDSKSASFWGLEWFTKSWMLHSSGRYLYLRGSLFGFLQTNEESSGWNMSGDVGGPSWGLLFCKPCRYAFLQAA
jgi:hypothetical protein